jgi:hypothetical protein
MGREAAAAAVQVQQQGQGQGGTAYTVEQLVAFNRYNPDILPDLENYVNDQVTFLLYHPYHLIRVYTIQFNSIPIISSGFIANLQPRIKSLPSSPLPGIHFLINRHFQIIA